MVKKTESLSSLIPVIILNWNGHEDTISCLKSILSSNRDNVLPVLVDNGSTIESLNALKEGVSKLYDNIIYLEESNILSNKELIENELIKDSNSLVFIQNFQNHGFAKGNNIGINVAKVINSNWVMLLNNDTEVVTDTFSQLFSYIKTNENIIALTPQIRLYNPNNKIWNCGGDLTYFGSRKYLYGNADIKKVPNSGLQKISFVTGCALLFQYKKTGVLSEQFFFGEEDYEFSLRLKSKKLKIHCLFDSVIYHKVGASIGKADKVLQNLTLYYINRLINTKKYYSFLRWSLTLILSFLYLPLLVFKSGYSPSRSIKMMKIIFLFIFNHHKVTYEDFINIRNLVI